MIECRLCDNTELIMDMFDRNIDNYRRNKWRYYVLLATGVYIRRDDVVSKMVCHSCCGLVEKIFKYRLNAMTNDKLLKERAGQPYMAPFTDTYEVQSIGWRILTDSEDVEPLSPEIQIKNINDVLVDPVLNDSIAVTVPVPDTTPVLRHDSVKDVMRTYPNLTLPERINGCDINPIISIDKNEVTEWYANSLQRKLSLNHITMRRVVGAAISSPQTETPALLPPIKKSQFKYKPCPKSKKIQKNETVVSENCLKIINQFVVPARDFCNTQIHQISTTTSDTRRKRKQRKKKIEILVDEVIPKKKQRVYHSSSARPAVMMDIPETIPKNAKEHKDLLASSLGLVRRENAIELADQDVFACKVCARIYDTRAQLNVHMKRHSLSCKDCGKRAASLMLLKIHENQKCHRRITQNPGNIPLERIDKVKCIKDKYPEVFESDDGLTSARTKPPVTNEVPVAVEVTVNEEVASSTRLQNQALERREIIPSSSDTSNSKENWFTDAELLEMLSSPMTPEHLPNTTFHYVSISAVTNKAPAIQKQTLPPHGNPPVQSAPPVNRTVDHEITETFPDYTNYIKEYYRSKASVEQQIRVLEETAEEWFQSEMTPLVSESSKVVANLAKSQPSTALTNDNVPNMTHYNNAPINVQLNTLYNNVHLNGTKNPNPNDFATNSHDPTSANRNCTITSNQVTHTPIQTAHWGNNSSILAQLFESSSNASQQAMVPHSKGSRNQPVIKERPHGTLSYIHPPANRTSPKQPSPNQRVPNFNHPNQSVSNYCIQTQHVPNPQVSNQCTPNQQIPIQRIPNQQGLNQQIINQDMHNQQIPNQDMHNQYIPNQDMHNQQIPNQSVPYQQIRNQGMHNHNTSNQGVHNQQIPNQGLSNQQIPNQSLSNQQIFNQGMPNQQILNRYLPNQPIPNRHVPNQPFPNQRKPNQRVSNQKVSNNNIPNQQHIPAHQITNQPISTVIKQRNYPSPITSNAKQFRRLPSDKQQISNNLNAVPNPSMVVAKRNSNQHVPNQYINPPPLPHPSQTTSNLPQPSPSHHQQKNSSHLRLSPSSVNIDHHQETIAKTPTPYPPFKRSMSAVVGSNTQARKSFLKLKPVSELN